MKPAGTVLVVEAVTRAAIEVIRSLQRQGLRVIAGASQRWCAAFCVRGLRSKVIYPSIESSPGAFIEWLMPYLAKHRIDMLISLGHFGAEIVAKHSEAIRRRTRLFAPSYEHFMLGHDKILGNKAAVEAGVPIPQAWYPDETGLDAVLKAARYPVLVKPAVGAGARGMVRASSATDLQHAWDALSRSCGRAFVQELVPLTGRQYVVDVLLDKEVRTVAAVVSEKIRFFPVSGGASTLSRSVHRPDLCDAVTRLLRSTGCYGVSNADFIEDPRDGSVKLLEVNPRFGEMHGICGAVGVDLPWMLACLAWGQEVPSVTDYPEGRYMRFLPTDTMCFLASGCRFRSKPGYLASFGKDVRHTLFGNGDFGPLIGYLFENLALLADPKRFAFRFIR